MTKFVTRTLGAFLYHTCAVLGAGAIYLFIREGSKKYASDMK